MHYYLHRMSGCVYPLSYSTPCNPFSPFLRCSGQAAISFNHGRVSLFSVQDRLAACFSDFAKITR